MPSDTVQLVNSIVAFAGVVFTGVLSYFMARLRQEEQARMVEQKTHQEATQEKVDVTAKKIETTSGKVDDIQRSLALIQHNRSNLVQLRDAMTEHGMALIKHAHEAAADLADATDAASVRKVIENYGQGVISATEVAITKLGDMTIADPAWPVPVEDIDDAEDHP